MEAGSGARAAGDAPRAAIRKRGAGDGRRVEGMSDNYSTMEMVKKEEVETGSQVNNAIGKDRSTSDECDPWNPPYPPYDSSTHKSFKEWCNQRNDFLKTTRATNIIIPDRMPESVNSDFYKIYSNLLPILKADSALRFRRFFVKQGEYITYGFIIIPEAFNQMIVEDALRCAQVALEGKATELEGFRANPNCMNQYGYFPLHEAAERFSVDMIKLLLHHGASANLRTSGNLVIENLLPLHVAVENTCLHKYLEDNLLQKHPSYLTKKDANYVYKIVHILCLPEMKIFLDTTRLLAEYTNNLVDEIWNYIEDGKLLETAVLLLAAQAHIRVGSTCRRNANGDIDGFSTLIVRISERCKASQLEMGQNDKEQLCLEVLSSAKLLVNIVAKAGQALDSYIQKHQEVPQANVLQHVTDILNIYGFFPTGEGNHSGNFSPYKWRPRPTRQLTKKHGNTVATEAAAKMPHLSPADEKAARRKLPRFSERECTWNNFFPYWRSVLACRYLVKVNPGHAQDDVMRLPNFDRNHLPLSSSFGKPSILVPSGTASSLARRITEVPSLHQSRKLFGTVALTILKVLKK